MVWWWFYNRNVHLWSHSLYGKRICKHHLSIVCMTLQSTAEIIYKYNYKYKHKYKYKCSPSHKFLFCNRSDCGYSHNHLCTHIGKHRSQLGCRILPCKVSKSSISFWDCKYVRNWGMTSSRGPLTQTSKLGVLNICDMYVCLYDVWCRKDMISRDR